MSGIDRPALSELSSQPDRTVHCGTPHLYLSEFDPRGAGGTQVIRIEVRDMPDACSSPLLLTLQSELINAGVPANYSVEITRQGTWLPVIVPFSSGDKGQGQYVIAVELRSNENDPVARQWVCPLVIPVPQPGTSLQQIAQAFFSTHEHITVSANDGSIARIEAVAAHLPNITASATDASIAHIKVDAVHSSGQKRKHCLEWSEKLFEIAPRTHGQLNDFNGCAAANIARASNLHTALHIAFQGIQRNADASVVADRIEEQAFDQEAANCGPTSEQTNLGSAGSNDENKIRDAAPPFNVDDGFESPITKKEFTLPCARKNDLRIWSPVTIAWLGAVVFSSGLGGYLFFAMDFKHPTEAGQNFAPQPADRTAPIQSPVDNAATIPDQKAELPASAAPTEEAESSVESPSTEDNVDWKSTGVARNIATVSHLLQPNQRIVLKWFRVTKPDQQFEFISVNWPGASIYLMDASEAQKFLNGEIFTRYAEISFDNGAFGVRDGVPLAAGDYVVAAENRTSGYYHLAGIFQEQAEVEGFRFRNRAFETLTRTMAVGERIVQPVFVNEQSRTFIDVALSGGKLFLIPYAAQDNFLNGREFEVEARNPCPIEGASVSFCELDLPSGNYGLALINDTIFNLKVVLAGRAYVPK